MTAADADIATETGALIDRIVLRCHETHRRELPGPIEFAAMVATVHAEDRQSPKDMVKALTALGREMEEHMAEEEMILFPAKRAGGGPGIGQGVPVLTGLTDTHRGAFERFAEGMDTTLAPEETVILDWCRMVAQAGSAERANRKPQS